MGILCGRAGRLTAKNGDFRPGQWSWRPSRRPRARRSHRSTGRLDAGSNRWGVQEARSNPLGLFLAPPGPLLTHLHTVYMAYSECLPTRLNPLAETTCFSQVELGNGWWNPLPLLFWGHDNLRAGLMSLQGRTSSEPMFKLLVLATMSDGSEKVLAASTPQGWKSGMCVHVGIACLSLIGRQQYSFAGLITLLPVPWWSYDCPLTCLPV